MMTKLQNPAIVAVLASIMSIALGVSLIWKAGAPLISQALAARPVKVLPFEQKERGWNFWTVEIENLASELKEERARQQKRAEVLDQREARLGAEETELAKVRADIEGLRKDINTKIIEVSSDEAKNIKSLAQAYTALSPKAAAAVVRELDDVTVVKILSVMKTETVAAIFEEMSVGAADASQAKRVAKLSEKIRLMHAPKKGAT